MLVAARSIGGSPFVFALAMIACTAQPTERADDVRAAQVGAPAPSKSVVVRVMAANTTSGNDQSYDPGHGTRMFQGLQPDVVLIQEFNVGANTDADARTYVDATFGPTFSFYRERTSLPNGVVSRYPILEAGSWKDPRTSTRGFAWAKIGVPGSHPLWAVSVHLLTSSSTHRREEATAVVGRIRSVVPDADFLVLGGDFNTGSRSEACVKTLAEVLKTAAPYPDDGRGNPNTSARRSEPLDWLLTDFDLAARQVPTRIGDREFPNGLVFDSRVYSPLQDVAPVQPSDSAAANMQHMPVVKDFVLDG